MLRYESRVFPRPVNTAEGCICDGYFSPHRTHSKRLISMPAAAADAGSKASLASTSAQTSPRWVAWARAKSKTLVLPDEAVPQISVRQPRGRPPVSKSSCGMPLDTISGAGRVSSREAGTTAVSLGMAPKRAKISAVFFLSVFWFVIGSAVFFTVFFTVFRDLYCDLYCDLLRGRARRRRRRKNKRAACDRR